MIPPRKPSSSHDEGNTDAWLMSYADMITLLLCFFIIYVSTSEPRQDRFAAATQGFQRQFGTLHLDTPYDGVYRDVQGIIKDNDADQNIDIEKTPRGLLMEVSAIHCFAGNSAEISSAQLPMLQAIAAAFKNTDLGKYTIEIEGHTDNTMADPAMFASNWELSAARAARVVRLFAEAGIAPGYLRAVALADTRPAVPNEDAGGRPIPENQARNQRVVIRVEKLQ